MEMYGGKFMEQKFLIMGLSMDILDYYTLTRIVGDRILNNTVYTKTKRKFCNILCNADK